MLWREECAAVIPCLNEASAIGPLVAAVRELLPSVLVIDDGSTDGTGAFARAAGATVLTHETPRGKGASLRDGWAHALAHNFTWALSLDGDAQHSPKDIPAFLAAAGSGAKLVCGNRRHASARMPLVRRWTNRFMSWQLSRLAALSLPDTQCGFRLMHLPSWASLPIQSECFEIESEVLIQFARAGLPIAFVPIQVIYGNERSKIRPVRDAWRWCRWLRAQSASVTQSTAGS